MANYIDGLRYKGGGVLITDPSAPRLVVERETYQCCHCNAHFLRPLGKGPKAMCLMCMLPTCGEKACNPCIPFEAKLEAWEGTRRFWRELEISTQHSNEH